MKKNAIEWKPEYSVNNEMIDQQHRGLLELFNQIADKEKGTDDAYSIFETLANYINEHLNTEESLMREKKYARYEMHKRQHDEFRQRVMELMAQYNMESPLVHDRLRLFLGDWLRNHIFSVKSEDQAYKGIL
ncbi:MAG: bacteriohemerythrin [Planctomycetota bacterium]